MIYIVMCQRGGVSIKPTLGSGQDKASFGPFTGGLDLRGSLQTAELTKAYTTYEKFKKETNSTFDPLFTKTG